MAVKTIQIADKPTLDATKALLEDSEVGLAAIKQAASSGAVSGTAGGLHVEKAINISPSMDINVSTLPYDFYNGSAVVFDGKIHIMGGKEYQCEKKHYEYDGSSWIETSAIPYDFYYGSAVVWNNELHIMGSNNSTCRAKHYSVKGDAHYVEVMLPKGTHILLPDNEEITYINNAVKITNNIAEVSETGCVEILAKYLEPGNIKDFLTFY